MIGDGNVHSEPSRKTTVLPNAASMVSRMVASGVRVIGRLQRPVPGHSGRQFGEKADFCLIAFA